jgi:hypothetical protein
VTPYPDLYFLQGKVLGKVAEALGRKCLVVERSPALARCFLFLGLPAAWPCLSLLCAVGCILQIVGLVDSTLLALPVIANVRWIRTPWMWFRLFFI